jgi:hypothetical protein
VKSVDSVCKKLLQKSIFVPYDIFCCAAGPRHARRDTVLGVKKRGAAEQIALETVQRI